MRIYVRASVHRFRVLSARLTCMTPMSSRMRSAGVHTASPQYLSRGKCSLSRITACAGVARRLEAVMVGMAGGAGVGQGSMISGRTLAPAFAR